MDRVKIEEIIYEILAEANLVEETEGKISINQDIDSIQLISVVVEIEERLGIEIPDAYLVTDILDSFEHLVVVVEDIMHM